MSSVIISQDATVPELNSQSSASPNVTPVKRQRARAGAEEKKDLDLPDSGEDSDTNKFGYLIFDDKEIANSLLSSAK